MRPLTPAILLASASLAVAFKHGEDFDPLGRAQHARNFQARSTEYKLVDYHGPQDFMNESRWSYFTDADPTGGHTKYLSYPDAAKAGLAYVQNNQAILAADSKNDLPFGTNRSSVRIMSKKAYRGGLVIADFAHMARGCGVWPAYWTIGKGPWPKGGEIDIIEGVNVRLQNQYTLHTGPDSPCHITAPTGVAPFTGILQSKKCASSQDDNAGCQFLDPDTNSFGHNFNVAGGSVFAYQLNWGGLKIWRFKRDSIPQDIKDHHPDPSSWPKPVASFSSSSLSCDLYSELTAQHLIINTAIGGGWATSDYPGCGCPGTLAEQITKGNNFKYAYWAINYIAMYK